MSTRNSSRTRQRSAAPSRSRRNPPLADALLKTVDLGLGTLLFVSPHLFGGKHPYGRLVVVALCVVVAIAWFARQMLLSDAKWTRSRVGAIPLLALAAVVLQLVPLPASWLGLLSPRIGELLPLWSANPESGPLLGTWQTLSLSPEDTRLALATLVAYALLFVTVVQRIETLADITRLMRLLGLSAAVVAGLGFVQYYTANGKFFWFYEYPFSSTANEIKAGFTCRNHFAHFLVLGLPMLLGWLMLQRHTDSAPRARKSGNHWHSHSEPTPLMAWLLGGLVLLVSSAILASLSRGGTLALGSVLLVVAGVYARAGLINSSHFTAGGLLLVLVMALLSVSGKYSDVTNRLDDLVAQNVQENRSVVSRQTIWAANLAAIRAGGLTGSGAGSHRFIYPVYLNEPADLEYTHAENGYLQIVTENGLPGLLLLLTTIATCGGMVVATLRNAHRKPQAQIIAGALAAALVASLVHSCVDFVWFIPACLCATLVLMACLVRLYQLTLPVVAHRTSLAPISRFNLTLAASLAGIWAVATVVPPARTSLAWEGYLLGSLANQRTSARELLASDRQQASLAESDELNGISMLEHLVQVVRDYPHMAKAQARLAAVLLGNFEQQQRHSENAMPISQIREAALASGFASQQELRTWLLQAFGEHSRLLFQAQYHARCAVALCPLQGEAYQCLAELCFLDPNPAANYQAFAQQALRVRPCDPDVLFAVGKNELIAGHDQQAIERWKMAYRVPANTRTTSCNSPPRGCQRPRSSRPSSPAGTRSTKFGTPIGKREIRKISGPCSSTPPSRPRRPPPRCTRQQPVPRGWHWPACNVNSTALKQPWQASSRPSASSPIGSPFATNWGCACWPSNNTASPNRICGGAISKFPTTPRSATICSGPPAARCRNWPARLLRPSLLKLCSVSSTCQFPGQSRYFPQPRCWPYRAWPPTTWPSSSASTGSSTPPRRSRSATRCCG